MTHERLISIPTACELLGGMSRATLYRRLKDDPNFPRALKLGRSTRFRLSEVESYIASLPAAADKAA